MKTENIKKILSITLVIALFMGMTACGDKVSDPYKNIDLDEYIEVGEYKGVTVNKLPEKKVTKKDVDNEIEKRLNFKATTKEVIEGKAKKGDTVNIDYSGTRNGERFEGGTAKDQDLVLGSGSMVPGFEEGIEGMEFGSKKTIDVTFPKDYSAPELAGKKAKFDITLNYKKEQEKPELDEKFIKENSREANNEEEFRKEIEEDLKKGTYDMETMQEQQMAWQQVMATVKVKKDDEGKEKYPEERIEAIKANIKNFYEKLAEDAGQDFGQWLQENAQMDEETFNMQLEEMAKGMAKEEMVVNYIAKKEDIKITSREYNLYLNSLYWMSMITEEEFIKQYDKTIEEIEGREMIQQNALKQKVISFVYDNGKVKKAAKKKKAD